MTVNNQYGWTLEKAIEIVQHPAVDSKVWSEAVEWLLLNGPPDIRQVLQEASGHAIKECFPDLETKGFTIEGETCYNVDDIAKVLNITKEEALQHIKEKESEHGIRQLFSDKETQKIQ